MSMRTLMLAALPLALAACATTGGGAKQAPASASTQKPAPAASTTPAPAAGKVSPYAPAQEDLSKRGDYVAGGLFRPGQADTVPDYIPNVDAIPEPEVRAEPRSRAGKRSHCRIRRGAASGASAIGAVGAAASTAAGSSTGAVACSHASNGNARASACASEFSTMVMNSR